MVSPELGELRAVYRQLQGLKIDPHCFGGRDFDAACDIIGAETFLAGVADTLLGSRRVSSLAERMLQEPLLSGSTWTAKDGNTYSLRESPELLSYAGLVDHIRAVCLKLAVQRKNLEQT